MTLRPIRLSLLALGCLGALVPASCRGEDEAAAPRLGERSEAVSVKGVLDAAGCSTAPVIPLAKQVIAVTNCLSPGILTAVPKVANFKPGSTTVAFMQKPAVDAFVAALGARPKSTFVSNSMLRTLAQQYLLRKWYEAGKCGITAAAKVGGSNHESGLAIDTSDYNAWRPALESEGFKWFGSSDLVHFDYKGAGVKALGAVEVKAFQLLWNENNPDDKIGTDGAYGPQTESRLAKSPAEGFAKVPGCGDPAPKDADGDGISDDKDNCDADKNADQLDLDKDKKGDVCDADDDDDGVNDDVDNCPRDANKDQADADGDKKGDACEKDDDGDGVTDDKDLCPTVADPDQADLDGDKTGDLCDADKDGDDVENAKDNCPGQPNDDQADADGDGVGDACDEDAPGDPEHDGAGGEGGASGAGGRAEEGGSGAAPVSGGRGGGAGKPAASGGAGVAGSGGSTGGGGAPGPRSGPSEVAGSSEDSGGCGVVTAPARTTGALWLGLVGAALAGRRRRRTP